MPARNLSAASLALSTAKQCRKRAVCRTTMSPRKAVVLLPMARYVPRCAKGLGHPSAQRLAALRLHLSLLCILRIENDTKSWRREPVLGNGFWSGRFWCVFPQSCLNAYKLQKCLCMDCGCWSGRFSHSSRLILSLPSTATILGSR